MHFKIFFKKNENIQQSKKLCFLLTTLPVQMDDVHWRCACASIRCYQREEEAGEEKTKRTKGVLSRRGWRASLSTWGAAAREEVEKTEGTRENGDIKPTAGIGLKYEHAR